MGLTLEDNRFKELQISSETRSNTQISEININAHRYVAGRVLFLTLTIRSEFAVKSRLNSRRRTAGRANS
jgi:hypothetical protein